VSHVVILIAKPHGSTGAALTVVDLHL